MESLKERLQTICDLIESGEDYATVLNNTEIELSEMLDSLFKSKNQCNPDKHS